MQVCGDCVGKVVEIVAKGLHRCIATLDEVHVSTAHFSDHTKASVPYSSATLVIVLPVEDGTQSINSTQGL